MEDCQCCVHKPEILCHTKVNVLYYHVDTVSCLLCFDAVGWVAGRASGL